MMASSGDSSLPVAIVIARSLFAYHWWSAYPALGLMQPRIRLVLSYQIVPPIAARLAHHLVLQQQQLLSLVPHPCLAALFVFQRGVTLAADSSNKAYLMPAAKSQGP